jgi:transposase
VAHANARTTVYGRQLMVDRYLAGWPAPRVAEQLGVSRATVYKWVHRYLTEGAAGLVDRSSRPHTSPNQLCAEVEAKILALRAELRRGPVFLAARLGLVASTVGRVLARHDVPALSAVDPITGTPIRHRHSGIRYERHTPGELLHVDVKKLGRVPNGVGGGYTVAARRSADAVSATTTSTSPSMTGPASPTSKLCPMNAISPAPGSCTAPWRGSAPTASWWHAF